ncbi:hypothetical protein [Streptomyces sp. NPDC058964]|uniref:hypothetical protein n=1 Tax=Streptomyces sp. NPDC058964 TaxID=3346681 RepID=UPI003684FE1D
MSYRSSGRYEALPGPYCRETPAGATLQLVTAQPVAKSVFTVLSAAQGAARETCRLADAELDHDRHFAVARTAAPPALLQSCQGGDV